MYTLIPHATELCQVIDAFIRYDGGIDVEADCVGGAPRGHRRVARQRRSRLPGRH